MIVYLHKSTGLRGDLMNYDYAYMMDIALSMYIHT